MLDLHKILTTIRRATDLFRSTPGRRGSIVTLAPESVEDILVVGDLHGHVDVFAQVLRLAQLDEHPGRHLVVQELAHDTRIDPDEDQLDRSHRLIDVVCAMKCKYPDRVHYLLGNHELSELTGRSISKNGHALNDLFHKGVFSDYRAHTEAMLIAYHGLFRSLPLAVRAPNRVLMIHTIPDARDLDAFDRATLMLDRWPDEALKRGGAVYAVTWGRDNRPETADRFAEMMDVDLFICGHEPCDDGYQKANHRMLILDGTEPSPAYCLFLADRPLTIDDLVEDTHLIPLLV
jgi:hypothetical protein